MSMPLLLLKPMAQLRHGDLLHSQQQRGCGVDIYWIVWQVFQALDCNHQRHMRLHTHTYQQDFHVAPNPKKTIKLGAPSKKGRYVRIQLLDKNYLS
jgi:hypothetical protein